MTRAAPQEKSEEPLSRHGAFEYLADDGSTVDLTQPGLLSRHQLVSIFRKRGFTLLMKNLPDKNSLLSAYFKYLLPLPARPSLNAPKDDGAVKILTGRTGMTATRETPKRPPLSAGPPGHQPTNKRRAPSPSLDSLVIISNPNWPTSGQSAPTTNNSALGEQGCTPAGDTKCSGPTATTSQPNPAPPLKRPKLKRSFSNLKR